MQDVVRQAYTHVAIASGPDAEFNAYLTSAPQTTEDVVGWWGVCLLSLPEFLTESVLRSIAFNTLHGCLLQDIISQYKDLWLLQNRYFPVVSESGPSGPDESLTWTQPEGLSPSVTGSTGVGLFLRVFTLIFRLGN